MNIKETAAFLRQHDKYLILTHARPDGDTLGCAAALCSCLREYGKTAYVLPNPETNGKFEVYIKDYYMPDDYEPECVVAVDAATKELLCINAQDYLDAVELCIDHHPTNSFYAENTCVYPDRAACGEIIYEISLELLGKVSAETACPLFLAIITDTGCFRYANTNENTHLVAAALLRDGAPGDELIYKFFRTKSRNATLFEGELKSSIEFYFEGKAAVLSISNSLREKYEVEDGEMEGVASLPVEIDDVVVGITIKETAEGKSKVSVRSVEPFDASALCAKFGGGGHRLAAGCFIDTDIESAKQLLLKAVEV